MGMVESVILTFWMLAICSGRRTGCGSKTAVREQRANRHQLRVLPDERLLIQCLLACSALMAKYSVGWGAVRNAERSGLAFMCWGSCSTRCRLVTRRLPITRVRNRTERACLGVACEDMMILR